MIRIFRKLSTQLKTNWLHYGLDTVVVIVGILIAIALNNWNEDRNARIKEHVLLAEMKQNLEADLADMQYNIRASKELLRTNKTVLFVLENNLPFHDSLRYYYGNILGNTQLSETSSAYENLKSIGFDLVTDESLRAKITHLYSLRYEYITSIERAVDDKFQFESIRPLVLEHFITETHWNEGPKESAYPVDQSALAGNHTFKEVLKYNIYIRNIMISQYETLLTEIMDLISHIETEIE